MTDPVKRDLLFPEEPPPPFGVKRRCLETNYFEVLDLPYVKLVDVGHKSGNEIAEFTEKKALHQRQMSSTLSRSPLGLARSLVA